MNTMTILNNSYHLLYKQALIDPTQLTEDELLDLLLKYPYSQPLVFAYERRKKLINQESPNKELALLYAFSEVWLMNYVNKPVSDPTVEPVTLTEVVPAAEETVLKEVITVPAEEIVDFITESKFTTDDEIIEPLAHIDVDDHEKEFEAKGLQDEHRAGDFENKDENAEQTLDIESLVQRGSIGGNYFVFDSSEKIENLKAEQSTALEATGEKDDMSLYNDDLMPYSFRWWLHKTRLEHANTYQPYISSNHEPIVTKPIENFSSIEDAVLDQQIKQNIINFQDPEDKLSEEVKNKPVVVPDVPKKGSEIIEKFILKDPIIKPLSPENINNENMARQSAEDNYVFVTETLANIYIDQGLYLKAIEVLKKLILKYPEKKSYFASRIENLEKNL